MMTTAAGALLNRSLLRPPVDYGYSDEAVGIRDKAQSIWKDFAPTFTVGIRFGGVVEAIREACEEASSDDWDGYGAKACDSASLERAYQFSSAMPESVPVPEVTVDPAGMLEFEWYSGARSVFSVTVKNDGWLVYAGLFGESKAYGRERLKEDMPKEIFDLIQRTYSR